MRDWLPKQPPHLEIFDGASEEGKAWADKAVVAKTRKAWLTVYLLFVDGFFGEAVFCGWVG